MTLEAKIKGVVDFVVLIDISGSMQGCIDAVEKSVSTLLNVMTSTDVNGGRLIKDWRLKVVGYRDSEKTDVDWFVDNPFVREVAGVQSQLSAPSMKVAGEGHGPESLLDALYKVASIGEAGLQDGEDANLWRPQAARAVIFFTDATFKPVMSLPEAKGGQLADVLTRLERDKVILFGFHPEWEGYDVLHTLSGSCLEPVASVADFPVMASLGKDGAEGLAAHKATVNGLRAKVGDIANFTGLMEQLTRAFRRAKPIDSFTLEEKGEPSKPPNPEIVSAAGSHNESEIARIRGMSLNKKKL